MIEEAEKRALLSAITRALKDTYGARIEALEAAQTKSLADAYQGVHLPMKQYQRGELTTHGGSLWLCLATTTVDAPGASAAWRLIVKAGAPGRDAQ